MYTNYEQRTTNKLLGQKVTVKKINVKRCWIRDSETLRPTNCLNFKKKKNPYCTPGYCNFGFDKPQLTIVLGRESYYRYL